MIMAADPEIMRAIGNLEGLLTGVHDKLDNHHDQFKKHDKEFEKLYGKFRKVERRQIWFSGVSASAGVGVGVIIRAFFKNMTPGG